MIDVLVTGAEGFIGRALVARLRAEGPVDVLPLSSRDGDVADAGTWDRLPPARVVIHLAGRSYVPDSWKSGADFLRVNVLGTEHALAYCRRHGAALVLASAYVTGIPTRLPIHEDDPARPSNPYALSKLMAEELCEFASRTGGVSATVLRLFNVYGPGQRREFLIPTIIDQVRQREEVRVLSLAPRRDYVYLADVVEALVRAARPSTGFRRINIGSGVSHSVAEVIATAQAVAGTHLPVVSDAVERPQEIPDTVAGIVRARDLLGWTPRWSLRDGINQIFEGSVS